MVNESLDLSALLQLLHGVFIVDTLCAAQALSATISQ